MEEIEFLADSIASRYGSIKRARGCFLYTAKGVRLTDLYAEGGRAILGWGGSPATTVLKDVLSRGICGSYRTDWDYRLDKAATDLLGFAAKAYAFARPEEAAEAARSLCPQQKAALWKPWTGHEGLSAQTAVLVTPPFPLAGNLTLLAVRKDCAPESPPPKRVLLPAPLAAAVSRSLYDIIKAEKERGETDFFIYDRVLTRYWRRNGPWLAPKVPQQRYREFVLHCMDCALVVSPCHGQDSIVPYGADPGVFRQLERRPFEFQQDAY